MRLTCFKNSADTTRKCDSHYMIHVNESSLVTISNILQRCWNFQNTFSDMDTSRITRASNTTSGSDETTGNEMSYLLMSNLFQLDRTLRLLHIELKKKNNSLFIMDKTVFIF